MCCHGRRYGYAIGDRGYANGCGYRRRHVGPIRALVRLAVPLITEKLNNSQSKAPAALAATPDVAALPQQITGHTQALPTADIYGPPPAYEDRKGQDEDVNELEKSLSETYITSPLQQRDGLPAVGARDYQPLQQVQSQNVPAPRSNMRLCDGSSRWAAHLQRKEEKLRNKLSRKADKYLRK